MTTMTRKRVLITGAAGYLSRQLLPVFRERYDLVLLDRRKPQDIDDIIEVDLVNPDIDAGGDRESSTPSLLLGQQYVAKLTAIKPASEGLIFVHETV